MSDDKWPVVPVVLIWELDRLKGTCYLRAIDDDEELAMRHLRAFRDEAKFDNRTEARFIAESSLRNHAFGFAEMGAVSIILRSAAKPS